jgi:hypothetical protein
MSYKLVSGQRDRYESIPDSNWHVKHGRCRGPHSSFIHARLFLAHLLRLFSPSPESPAISLTPPRDLRRYLCYDRLAAFLSVRGTNLQSEKRAHS